MATLLLCVATLAQPSPVFSTPPTKVNVTFDGVTIPLDIIPGRSSGSNNTVNGWSVKLPNGTAIGLIIDRNPFGKLAVVAGMGDAKGETTGSWYSQVNVTGQLPTTFNLTIPARGYGHTAITLQGVP